MPKVRKNKWGTASATKNEQDDDDGKGGWRNIYDQNERKWPLII